ncbi:hypothetical protein KKA13_01795 [Patescibacteria group bacterium]|nr:hypothetical protein [Patescibacteria group bacterium]MBU1613198.1 hypothetical protein [Patescibacteria group bacterium]
MTFDEFVREFNRLKEMGELSEEEHTRAMSFVRMICVSVLRRHGKWMKPPTRLVAFPEDLPHGTKLTPQEKREAERFTDYLDELQRPS